MGLFSWLRSKRPAPPAALPVRYGLGPPPPPTPGELCPICAGEVIQVDRWFHSEFHSSWRGRCSSCDAALSRSFESPSWQPPCMVPPEDWGEVVSEKELDALTAQFTQLELMPCDYFWKALLAGRRSGDEVRRVASEEGRAWFVLVRGGRMLDEFFGPKPSHVQEWLALKAKHAKKIERGAQPSKPSAESDPAT